MTDFNHWKHQLTDIAPQEGLQLISSAISGSAKLSTSFGLEDQVITHMIATGRLNLSIFTIDTGRLFQETYDVFELTRNQYGVTIQVFYPNQSSVEQLITAKGPNSFYHSVENRKECCSIRKVEPLNRALSDATFWITGIRAEQSANRQQMTSVEWDDQHQVIKYHPLFHWSQQQVDEYIHLHNVPINTLHRKGYPSIGCAPCTRAVAEGEDPRSGRWWWEGSAKECGLHTVKI